MTSDCKISSSKDYPLSPFQENLSLMPIDCKITPEALKKIQDLSSAKLHIGLGSDYEYSKDTRLLYINSDFFRRIQFFDDGVQKTKVWPVAPALCKGFDDECKRRGIYAPKGMSLSCERVVYNDPSPVDEAMIDMRAIFEYSTQNVRQFAPFIALPTVENPNDARDYLSLSIGFYQGKWKLISQFVTAETWTLERRASFS